MTRHGWLFGVMSLAAAWRAAGCEINGTNQPQALPHMATGLIPAS
jgi:hypothetical protein